jgi:hypothetical protein
MLEPESQEVENNPPTGGRESTAQPETDPQTDLDADGSPAEPPAGEGNSSAKDEETQAPQTSENQEFESTAQKDDNDEFVVVSPDEAPIELAEEYPPNKVRSPSIVLTEDR